MISLGCTCFARVGVFVLLFAVRVLFGCYLLFALVIKLLCRGGCFLLFVLILCCLLLWLRLVLHCKSRLVFCVFHFCFASGFV